MKNLKTLVTTALFAALCCVATMVIQIPSPMNGYVNLGDCFVLLSGWILGPWHGFIAAGIGSMLADLLTGYAYYAPATFLVKGIMALIAAGLLPFFARIFHGTFQLDRIASAIVAEAAMVGGYFVYACIFLRNGLAAAASIPGNIVQGVIGLVVSLLIFTIFSKTNLSQYL